jgi:4-hydroxy-3-polyprenylbenzoate decarboxylase
LAVTGASGAIYAKRFLLKAVGHFDEIYLTMSVQAVQVAQIELGLEGPWSVGAWLGHEPANVRILDSKDYFTPPASGSFRHSGMVVVPCSMGTLGRIANGISDDLTTRAADVCLKEHRPLILVPREMPWNLVMLRNAVAACEAGATILPACPAWYSGASSAEALADTVVARILQHLGVDHGIMPEWGVRTGDGPDSSAT